MHNNLLKENIKEVTIGDSVWIAAEAHILKGTYISANSIVAYRATVLGKFEEPLFELRILSPSSYSIK